MIFCLRFIFIAIAYIAYFHHLSPEWNYYGRVGNTIIDSNKNFFGLPSFPNHPENEKYEDFFFFKFRRFFRTVREKRTKIKQF